MITFQQYSKSSLERKTMDEIYGDTKNNGIHFTPDILAQFISQKIISNYDFSNKQALKILDPAIGDGGLIKPFLEQLQAKSSINFRVYGFDTKQENVDCAISTISRMLPRENISINKQDFLDYFIYEDDKGKDQFDLIISNPPYIRTQVLGSDYCKIISSILGLSGRVDMYYAFLDGIAKILAPSGIAGVIVSNKFMTNRSGGEIRRRILKNFDILSIWDFGDTKIFRAAVLPCILLLRKKNDKESNSPVPTLFTSIYSSPSNQSEIKVFSDPTLAITCGEGGVRIGNHTYSVNTGVLKYKTPNGIWHLSNKQIDDWMRSVKDNTWAYFEDVAQIKVGIKTTADEVFIRKNWDDLELLRPLTTHKVARQFRSIKNEEEEGVKVLYPYEESSKKRVPVDLEKYPRAKKYLESHFCRLNSRGYIHEAKRKWYEIWVPHDPSAWRNPKIVFRDISKEPTFWIDLEGTIVNGDCYWISARKADDINILWLILAISNSKFTEEYYDYHFNNKLYAGRRRFMTQYVNKFPLPDPKSERAKKLVSLAQEIYYCEEGNKINSLTQELNRQVFAAFGL